MNAEATLPVEVACALPDRQRVVTVRVAPGTTAREAVRASGIAAEFPALDIEGCPVGIWGQVVPGEQVLRAGDRVEIYRPLESDPREARRAAVARGGFMGRGR